jgi:hypothetical protein
VEQVRVNIINGQQTEYTHSGLLFIRAEFTLAGKDSARAPKQAERNLPSLTADLWTTSSGLVAP